jgi:hypothetical protein
MDARSVKRVAGDANCLFWSLTILLENVSYYFVLRYLTAYAEAMVHCAEYNTKSIEIQWVPTLVKA